MTEEELTRTLFSEMDKWPEEKRQEFAGTLQNILTDKPEDPSALEAWSNDGKKKFLKAFGMATD